jgi:hypothetical protein
MIAAALLLEQREVVVHAQLAFEPTPHPVPSGLPSGLHLLGHPPSWDAAPLLLYPGETEAQTNEKDNDRSDKNEEQQYLHEPPPSPPYLVFLPYGIPATVRDPDAPAFQPP